jgi:23S rRNA pseudouridine955/2504/2580 synthase
MSGVETVVVRAEDADQRLDRWLRRRFPGLTQGRIEKLLRTGQIRLDGKRAESKSRIFAGQAVRLPPNIGEAPAPAARPVDDKDRRFLRDLILHEDDDVIALNKPAGLAVQGGTGTTRHLDAMLGALATADGERPRLVHRLDRDTSGALLLARNARAAARLAEAFRSRTAQKSYWALVVGVPHRAQGRIEMALAKVAGATGERVAADAEDGLRAVTLYAIVERVGDRAAWLEMRPVTGRTHQLRVHAASGLGTPIVGDAKYAGARSAIPGAGLAPLLHLHARRIVIAHPRRGTLDVAAPLPSHMKAAWAFFGFDVHADTDALFA